MDISTGLGLLAGVVVVLTMIFMGGDLRMFITNQYPTSDYNNRQYRAQNHRELLTTRIMSPTVGDMR
jgi:hypothetical protein